MSNFTEFQSLLPMFQKLKLIDYQTHRTLYKGLATNFVWTNKYILCSIAARHSTLILYVIELIAK